MNGSGRCRGRTAAGERARAGLEEVLKIYLYVVTLEMLISDVLTAGGR